MSRHKRLALGLALAAAFSAAPSPAAVHADAGGCASPTNDRIYSTQYWRVNVRSGPGTSYRVVGQIGRYATNFACGPGIEYRTNDGTRGCSTGWWAKLSWYGVYRYVCTTYLRWSR
jgi:hypothetical protein